VITVNLPDGRTIQVNTDDPEVAARAAHTYRTSNPHPQPEKSLANTIGGFLGDAFDAAIPGSAGAIRGAGDVVKNAVQAPFSSSVDFHPGQAYREGQAFQEARQKRANSEHPILGSASQVGGFAASLLAPVSKVPRAASLAQKAVAGAKTAAAYSALSGALSSKAGGVLGAASRAL